MPGGFNPANYEQVEVRLDRFWVDHPDGRVLTELTFDDGNRTVFRVEIYTDREDTRPAATGHATETVSDRGVNSTSALENCETSAVGRALANLNYAPKGQRPSREEMSKTETARAAQQGNGRRPPQNGNGQGNRQAPRPPQNGQQNGQPEETPEQRTARYVDNLLHAADDKLADWWSNKIAEFNLGNRVVTDLVSSGVREALGIGDVPLTANQLVELVRDYATRHHSGPAHVPPPTTDARDTPDPGSTTPRREPVPSAG